MNVSVIIPTFNCAATIRETLDSILAQSCPALEILVMDDGSTDETMAILEGYRSKISAFRQPNAGPSRARGALIEAARGDLIAFIDSDDIWHPDYLSAQRELAERFPQAAATFTGHRVFYGPETLRWEKDPTGLPANLELIDPLDFLKRYNAAPGYFYPSFCCVPSRVLKAMGQDPFRGRVAEDCYFYNRLALFGPVAVTDLPLVAYRIREGSLSSDLVKLCAGAVESFEWLEEEFRACSDAQFRRAFSQAYGVRRRDYAKALLGASRTAEGREQLRRSFGSDRAMKSRAKSLRLLLLTYLPANLQPNWPVAARKLEEFNN